MNIASSSSSGYSSAKISSGFLDSRLAGSAADHCNCHFQPGWRSESYVASAILPPTTGSYWKRLNCSVWTLLRVWPWDFGSGCFEICNEVVLLFLELCWWLLLVVLVLEHQSHFCSSIAILASWLSKLSLQLCTPNFQHGQLAFAQCLPQASGWYSPCAPSSLRCCWCISIWEPPEAWLLTTQLPVENWNWRASSWPLESSEFALNWFLRFLCCSQGCWCAISPVSLLDVLVWIPPPSYLHRSCFEHAGCSSVAPRCSWATPAYRFRSGIPASAGIGFHLISVLAVEVC